MKKAPKTMVKSEKKNQSFDCLSSDSRLAALNILLLCVFS